MPCTIFHFFLFFCSDKFEYNFEPDFSVCLFVYLFKMFNLVINFCWKEDKNFDIFFVLCFAENFHSWRIYVFLLSIIIPITRKYFLVEKTPPWLTETKWKIFLCKEEFCSPWSTRILPPEKNFLAKKKFVTKIPE